MKLPFEEVFSIHVWGGLYIHIKSLRYVWGFSWCLPTDTGEIQWSIAA